MMVVVIKIIMTIEASKQENSDIILFKHNNSGSSSFDPNNHKEVRSDPGCPPCSRNKRLFGSLVHSERLMKV